MDPTTRPDTAFLLAYFGFIAIFALVLFVLTLIVQWRIAVKAGYSGVASLLMIVPLVNLAVIIYFAFSEWPIERALKLARGETLAPTIPPSVPYLPPPSV